MAVLSKVLVVEDDVIIAADIQETLQRLGYDVPTTVDNSDDVLQELGSRELDLVLMDIRLRGPIDGIATVGRIRAVSDVPVVYLTSHSDEATLARAKETAPHGYLVKPFSERDLRTAIEVAIRKRQLERHIAERERWFSTTLESLGDAVIATDSAERITFMNPVAEAITGFTKAEAAGRPIGEVFSLTDDAGVEVESPVGRAIREKFAVTLPPSTHLVGKDGTSRIVDDSAAPIIDDRGHMLGGVIVFRDITEQKRLERRLAISERMASVGTMAAGIAHEINNPLAAVVANVSFAIEELRALKASLATVDGAEGISSRLTEMEQALSDADDCADRVRKIVRTMGHFARPSTLDRQNVNIAEAVENALRVTDNVIRHKAQVVRTYGTTPLVEVSEGQLVQVFTNLFSNAADAIRDGHTATNEIRITTFTDENGWGVVEVHDSGDGIPRTNIGHIFDPFFTTKKVGEGMGLGLAISHAFIVSAGGTLTAESEPGQGSTFRVALPPAARRRTVPPSGVIPSPAVTKRLRILVVDDEILVARAVQRTLRDHHVVMETSGNAAVTRLAEGELFDLVLCDLMMPNMTGAEVFDAVLAFDPAMAQRIVFLTGGAFSPSTAEFLESIPNDVISKPVNAETLREVVRSFVR